MNLFKKENGSIDFGFTAVVVLVAGIAVWLLLMPWVPKIASSSMHRFHLRSDSFAWFAVQAPIPSMYNFANTYVVHELPPGLADPLFGTDTLEPRYLNHYPTRVFTFADGRYYHLRHGAPRWLTITSRYRGAELQTMIFAEPNEDDEGFKWVRLPIEGGES